MTALQAITFDFWNTLAYEGRSGLRERRVVALSGILEDRGFAVERQQLDLAMDESWQRFQRSWEAGEQYVYAHAAEDIIEALGFEVPDDARAALIEAFGNVGNDAELHLTDGIGDTLEELKRRGLRIGIICDVGMTPSRSLRAFLDRAGVLAHFDHWSFSDEVGAYKPSPVIFEHALDGLGGVAPAAAAHIGDLRRTDVAGALGMGMTAVRYTGVFDDAEHDGPDAHHVLAHHPDLLVALELG